VWREWPSVASPLGLAAGRVAASGVSVARHTWPHSSPAVARASLAGQAGHFRRAGMQQLLPELTSEPRLLEMLIIRAAPSIEITCDVCEARMG
jgi:hypothetical protein